MTPDDLRFLANALEAKDAPPGDSRNKVARQLHKKATEMMYEAAELDRLSQPVLSGEVERVLRETRANADANENLDPTEQRELCDLIERQAAEVGRLRDGVSYQEGRAEIAGVRAIEAEAKLEDAEASLSTLQARYTELQLRLEKLNAARLVCERDETPVPHYLIIEACEPFTPPTGRE